MQFRHPHHNNIKLLLDKLNIDFLEKHRILFGGGTRLTLELGEYRESVDVYLLCPDKNSYRAARETVSNVSLGDIMKEPVNYLRDIRFDRYAIRTLLEINGSKIKVEVVSFDNYQLKAQRPSFIGVPCLDHQSCYLTKLLAHSDRKESPDKKDLIDLLMMYKHWGLPAGKTWDAVRSHYGHAPENDLKIKLFECADQPNSIVIAAQHLHMTKRQANELSDLAKTWLSHYEKSETN